MNLKKNILIIFILCFLHASFVWAGITNTEICPRPANPPTFGPNHKTTDLTFGSTILRVTGPSGSNAVYEDSNETQNLAPIQHFHNPWSYTGNHFLVWADRLSQGAGARVDLYEINRTTFTVSRVRTVGNPISKMNYNRGVHFDNNNEWIVYSADTSSSPNCIRRWNLNPNNSQEGLAPGSDECLHSDPEGIRQMTQSNDDNRFSYYTDKNKVKVWIRSTNTTYTLDCSSWYMFDESQISDDGKYVFIKGYRTSGDKHAYCYRYDFSEHWDYSPYSPDYTAGKHSGNGNKWVNECSQFPEYRLAARTLDSDKPGTVPTWAFIAADNRLGGTHPSYSNQSYIYAGFFYPGTVPSPWPVYHDEIVRIKDDGTEVLRLAHAWSNFFDNSYDEIPTYASPAGDYVIFYSNWNGSNTNARHDVFIIQVAEGATPNPLYPPENLHIENP